MILNLDQYCISDQLIIKLTKTTVNVTRDCEEGEKAEGRRPPNSDRPQGPTKSETDF